MPKIKFDITLWLAKPITMPAIPPAMSKPERSRPKIGRTIK